MFGLSIFKKKDKELPIPLVDAISNYETAKLAMKLTANGVEVTRNMGNWIPSGIIEVTMRPCPLWVTAVEEKYAKQYEKEGLCEPYCYDSGPITINIGDTKCILELFNPDALRGAVGLTGHYESTWKAALPAVQMEPRPTAANERYAHAQRERLEENSDVFMLEEK